MIGIENYNRLQSNFIYDKFYTYGWYKIYNGYGCLIYVNLLFSHFVEFTRITCLRHPFVFYKKCKRVQSIERGDVSRTS